MATVPVAPPDEVMVIVRFTPEPPKEMPAFDTMAGTDDVAVSVRLEAAWSTSLTVTGTGPAGTVEGEDWSEMGPTSGGSFTGVTVARKILVARALLVSCTTIEMLAEPNWLVSGWSVTVRLLPKPPSEIDESGMSAGLPEVISRLSCEADVSGSEMVKASGPMMVSSRMVWFVMEEIVGGWFVNGCGAPLPWKSETTSDALSVAP